MRKKRLLGIVLLLFSVSTLAHKPLTPCSDTEQYCNPHSFMYTLGSTVTTSPLLGIRSAFDAHDVIVNLPTMNEDLRILMQRLELKQHMGTDGVPCARRPLLEISGDVVGAASWVSPFEGGSRHDINLTGARLDFLAEVSTWAFGYISVNYDDSRLPNAFACSGQRIANSRILLKRGFLTLGDLDIYPVYFTIGQMFVPFGRYANYILSNPVTRAIGQTSARAALLGVSYCNVYASVYTFNGDSDVGSTGINQWGANLGAKFHYCDVAGEAGVGVIGNIADSFGFQVTGASNEDAFPGFACDVDSENVDNPEELHCRVPGLDLHASLSWRCVGVNAEYISCLSSFDKRDLSFNENGARPCVLHVEGHVNFHICDKPMAVTVGYGHTTEALALNLPRDSVMAALSGSFWKNTIAGFEYRYDKNYCDDDTASGNELPEIAAKGSSRNSVVGQIGIYF